MEKIDFIEYDNMLKKNQVDFLKCFYSDLINIINKYKNAEASNNAEITRLLNLENAKKRSEIESLISQLSPGIRNLFKMSIIDFKKDIKIKFPNMNLPGALL